MSDAVISLTCLEDAPVPWVTLRRASKTWYRALILVSSCFSRKTTRRRRTSYADDSFGGLCLVNARSTHPDSAHLMESAWLRFASCIDAPTRLNAFWVVLDDFHP